LAPAPAKDTRHAAARRSSSGALDIAATSKLGARLGLTEEDEGEKGDYGAYSVLEVLDGSWVDI
jgi:hypothetical protein